VSDNHRSIMLNDTKSLADRPRPTNEAVKSWHCRLGERPATSHQHGQEDLPEVDADQHAKRL
jgi:hypothetical protein